MMLGNKLCRRRRLHTLLLTFFFSLSVFYSFTVIRKSFLVCEESWSPEELKVSEQSILQGCHDFAWSKNCSDMQTGAPVIQNSLWEKYVVLGKPKLKKGILTVGYIHTEDCGKTKNLERSLGSLFLHVKKTKLDEISVIIPLRNCSEIDNTRFLNKMKAKYKYWIGNTVLQIIQIPHKFQLNSNDRSQYWEKFTSYSPEYIKESKSLLRNIAFLWTFSTNQSDYFVQFTDHVTVEGDLLASVQAATKDWPKHGWLYAENFPGFLTGSMYKTDSFTDLVELVDIFASYLPINFILKFYKRNFRISRSVYEITEPLPIREHFEFNGDNPEAVVTTSLVLGGGVSVQDLYKYRKGYFWAWTPTPGDYILIDFKSFIHIKRVLIETGVYLHEDICPEGVVSVVFGDENERTSPMCNERGKFVAVAEFKEPSVDISGRKLSSKGIGCIKINVGPVKSQVFDAWIAVRTIAVFTT